MKIVCISDTHNLHHKLELPEGDVLIHAGDATMRGRPHEVENFLGWLDSRRFKQIIFVPGNHDFLFDRSRSNDEQHRIGKDLLRKFSHVTYLRDKSVILPNGMLAYGTPWVKGLEDWAFGWKSDEGRQAEFAAIPPDINVLITHGPQFGVLDLLHSYNLGDEQLSNRIKELTNLKLHVHGHIHYSYGVVCPPIGATGLISVNAAQCSEHYSIKSQAIVIELED